MRLTVILLASLLAAAALAQDCTIGNSQSLFGYDVGWAQAAAVYAQLAPRSSGCGCEAGFGVDEVRVSLLMEAGATVRVRARLVDADDDGGCPVPGQVLAVSDEVLFDGASTTGVYVVVIPCAFQCAVAWYDYFLSVELVAATGVVEVPFTSADTGVPDKQAPGEPCTSYMDAGAGWEDMILAGFGGGLPISATASCCGDPIEQDVDAWGQVKRLYR